MQEALDRLCGLLDADRLLSAVEQQELRAIWHPFSAPRKSVLTSQGDIEQYLYFVCDGLQRVCHFDAEGREATVVFTFAPSFGGVLDSFLLQQPSQYAYETLSPSSFIRTRHADLEALMLRCPGIMRVMHLGTARALSGVVERLVELQSLSSEEKFRRLLKRSPHVLQLVPHKYLANYIGIDPTNFSKLMNSVRV